MAKYRNKRVSLNNYTFDSKREAAAYQKLLAMEKCGAIKDLMTKCKQCRFPLTVNKILICTYVADFVYYDCTLQRMVVADAKGFRTREYILKKKLMLALHQIDILEL